MLLRGRNTVGYTPYPDEVDRRLRRTRRPRTGIDIFRIFDALNDVDQMRPAIEAVRDTGTAVAEVALCYTGDLIDPARSSTPSTTTCGSPTRSSTPGAHVLAIKDMAGPAARPGRRAPSSRRCASASTCPCTCTPTTPPVASSRRCSRPIDAGVDAVDAASAADGRDHEPAAAVRPRRGPRPHRARRPASTSSAVVRRSSPTGRPSARLYRAVRVRPARARPGASTATRSPVASCRTCASRRSRSGLGDRFEEIEDMYAAADRILGNLVKVTPSSKVVGDLALHLVGAGRRPGRLRGEPGALRHPRLGHRLPRGRARRPARRLARAVPHQGARTGARPGPAVTELTAEQEDGPGRRPDGATLNQLLFPGPTKEFEDSRERYGDLSVLGTSEFLYGLRPRRRSTRSSIEAGKRLHPRAAARSASPTSRACARSCAPSTASSGRCRCATASVVGRRQGRREGRPRRTPGHVAAPFAGVVTPVVAEGDTGRGRRRRRDDRGDEDGGHHHRARRPGPSQRLAIAGHQQVRAATSSSSSAKPEQDVGPRVPQSPGSSVARHTVKHCTSVTTGPRCSSPAKETPWVSATRWTTRRTT